MDQRVIVVGAGSTGIFTALDLAGRGISVLLLDHKGIVRGTSGRNHGLVHSGARYATNDPSAAMQCASEGEILARIAPHSILHSGGYFVSLKDEDDQTYTDHFTRSLDECGIKYENIKPSELFSIEPLLNPQVEIAFHVPDRVVDPFKFLGGAALLAKKLGVKFRLDSKVLSIDPDLGLVRTTDGEFRGDAIINATGPWAMNVASASGQKIEIMPTLGVLVVYGERVVNNVINHLRPPSDGDVILPFYQSSILGTSALVIQDPDMEEVKPEDVEPLVREGSKLIPSLARREWSRYYYSVRPLLKGDGARSATREFGIFEHERLLTVIGGKLTTARLMGERVADVVGKNLGITEPSRTKEVTLPDPFESASFEHTIGDERYSLGMSLARLEKFLQE